MGGLFAAVQFLTRIPVPAGEYRLASSFGWLPVVGLLLGGLLAAADLGLRMLGAPSLLDSATLVVALLALTGGLHADGLMDTCDGVFVHAAPERRLEIMRDSRVGAFGVMGLASVLLLKLCALDALTGLARTQLLILAPTVGRWAIVLLAGLFPYGRSTGLGAPLKAAASGRALLPASVLPLVACAATWPIGVAAAGVALLAVYLVGRWLMRLLPGLTGDTYGAGCEVAETLVWVVGAYVMPRLTAS